MDFHFENGMSIYSIQQSDNFGVHCCPTGNGVSSESTYLPLRSAGMKRSAIRGSAVRTDAQHRRPKAVRQSDRASTQNQSSAFKGLARFLIRWRTDDRVKDCGVISVGHNYYDNY